MPCFAEIAFALDAISFCACTLQTTSNGLQANRLCKFVGQLFCYDSRPLASLAEWVGELTHTCKGVRLTAVARMPCTGFWLLT